jgi:hypothetical protein
MNECCLTCRFAHRPDRLKPQMAHAKKVFCRFLPPVVALVVEASAIATAGQPQTMALDWRRPDRDESDWCGQWKETDVNHPGVGE